MEKKNEIMPDLDSDNIMIQHIAIIDNFQKRLLDGWEFFKK